MARTKVYIKSKGIFSVGDSQIAGPGEVFLTEQQLEIIKRNRFIEYAVMVFTESQTPIPTKNIIVEETSKIQTDSNPVVTTEAKPIIEANTTSTTGAAATTTKIQGQGKRGPKAKKVE